MMESFQQRGLLRHMRDAAVAAAQPRRCVPRHLPSAPNARLIVVPRKAIMAPRFAGWCHRREAANALVGAGGGRTAVQLGLADYLSADGENVLEATLLRARRI